MTTPEFPEEQVAGTPSNLADWGTRAIGWLIDAAPIIILQAVVYWSTVLTSLIGVVSFLYFYLYLGNLDGTTGQTPGKAVMGIRVVNAKGELLGSGTGIARKFAHIIDSVVCLLGWLLPLVDSARQTIADKVVSSYVVTGVEKKSFSIDLYLPQQNKAA